MKPPLGSGNPESFQIVTPPETPLSIPEQMDDYQRAHAVAGLALSQSVAVRFSESSQLRVDICDMRNSFTIFSTGVLQAAHPVIGDALASQSRFFGSIWDRLDSSARAITQIFLSENGTAEGHRIRDYHRYVFGRDEDGRRVSAMHPEPYTWGWATILDMVEQKKRRFEARGESEVDWDKWYQEGRIAYQCQGVSDRLLPTDYESYRTYVDQVCETKLQRTPAVDRFFTQVESGEIERPPQVPPMLWNKAAQSLFSKYVRLITVGGCPKQPGIS